MLTARQELATFHIAEGLTQAEAAKLAGVTEMTITRWMKLDHFRGRIRERIDSPYWLARRGREADSASRAGRG